MNALPAKGRAPSTVFVPYIQTDLTETQPRNGAFGAGGVQRHIRTRPVRHVLGYHFLIRWCRGRQSVGLCSFQGINQANLAFV